MSSTIHSVASILRGHNLHSLYGVFDSYCQGSNTFEDLIFLETPRVEFYVILKAFLELTIFMHLTRHIRTAILCSDFCHLILCWDIMISINVCCIALRHCFVLGNASAVLIPITLLTLFAKALFIIIAVHFRASINWRYPMTLIVFYPLFRVTSAFRIIWISIFGKQQKT